MHVFGAPGDLVWASRVVVLRARRRLPHPHPRRAASPWTASTCTTSTPENLRRQIPVAEGGHSLDNCQGTRLSEQPSGAQQRGRARPRPQRTPQGAPALSRRPGCTPAGRHASTRRRGKRGPKSRPRLGASAAAARPRSGRNDNPRDSPPAGHPQRGPDEPVQTVPWARIAPSARWTASPCRSIRTRTPTPGRRTRSGRRHSRRSGRRAARSVLLIRTSLISSRS